MIFITGPLYSGKRTFARRLGGRQMADAQDLAAGAENLERLADELAAQYDVVMATERGGRSSGLPAGCARGYGDRDVLRHCDGAQGRNAMLIVLLRHGETAYNAQRRYQGKSDIPLSARGRARLRAADFAPDVVFVTALCRTAQTAAAIFPGARQAVEDDLR